MKLELLKLVLLGLSVRLCGQILPRGAFKRLLIQCLSVQTLSLNLSNTLRVQTPKSVKRSPSYAHRPQRATKITLTVNTEISQTLTVKHSPSSTCNENHPHCQTLFSFLKPHSDDPLTHTLKIPFVPTNGSSDFVKFEGMFSYKNLSFLNNYSIWV